MEHLWVTQLDHLARCCCRTAGRHADAARPATYKELRLGHMIGEGACIPAQDGRRAAKVSLVWQQQVSQPQDVFEVYKGPTRKIFEVYNCCYKTKKPRTPAGWP